MTNFRFLPVFLATACLLAVNPAVAVEFNSKFITYDLSKCLKLDRQASQTQMVCIGDNDIPVWIITARTSMDTFVGYGESGPHALAARETLPGTVSVQPLIEWRRSKQDGTWRTFAAIQRWLTRDERGIRGETLVITKIEAGESCHIAYLDAVVTPNVQARARYIADLCAPKFRCGEHEAMTIEGPAEEDQRRICTTSWAGFVAPLR